MATDNTTTKRIIASVVDTYGLMIIVILSFWLMGKTSEQNNTTAAVIYIIVLPLYHFTMDYWFQGSIGKRLLGLRVVADDCTSISASQAVMRALFLVPELFLWFVSVFIVSKTHRYKRIGDIIANTSVKQVVVSYHM